MPFESIRDQSIIIAYITKLFCNMSHVTTILKGIVLLAIHMIMLIFRNIISVGVLAKFQCMFSSGCKSTSSCYQHLFGLVWRHHGRLHYVLST